MKRYPPSRAQLKIDFEVDERVEALAGELALRVGARLPALKAAAEADVHDQLDKLCAELASMAWRRFARHEEPGEVIRCHDCDHPTRHDERVRVVVCTRCALAGNSPGSDG